MAEEELPKEVTILSETEIVTYPRIGEEKRQIAVTYVAPGFPPRTIFIPAEEYSEERVKELIKEDLKQLKKRKVRTVRLA